MTKSISIVIILLLACLSEIKAANQAVIIANCTDNYNVNGDIINNTVSQNFLLNSFDSSVEVGCINCIPGINYKLGFTAHLIDSNKKVIAYVTEDTGSYPEDFSPSTSPKGDISVVHTSVSCPKGEKYLPYTLHKYAFVSVYEPSFSCAKAPSCFLDEHLNQLPKMFGAQLINKADHPGKK